MAAALLPSEVLYLIFSSLDPRSLHRVCASSSQLREIASLSALWQDHCQLFWPSSLNYSAEPHMKQWHTWRQHMWAEDMASLVERQKALICEEQDTNEASGVSILSLDTLLGPTSTLRPASPDFYGLFLTRVQTDHGFVCTLKGIIVDSKEEPPTSTLGGRPPRRRLASSCQLVLEYGQDVRDFLHKLAWDQTIDGSNVDQVMARFRQEQENEWLSVYDIHMRLSDGQGSRRPHRDYHLALQHYARSILGYFQRVEGLGVLRQIREYEMASRALGRLSGATWSARQSTEAVEEALAALACFRGGDPAEISRYLDLLALSCYFSLSPWTSASPTSLRDAVRGIMSHLQRLGLAIAEPLHFLDIDNPFLHISLMCPENRATLPLTLTLILCAVARRLGLAAALCNTPGRIVAVVQEDSGCFYVDASKDDPVSGDLRNFAGEGQTVYNEAVASVEWRPASPAELMRRNSANILNAVQNGRGMPRVIHVHSAHARRSREQQIDVKRGKGKAGEGDTPTPADDLFRFLSTHPKDHPALLSRGGPSVAALEKALLSTTHTTLPTSRRSSARQEDEEDATYAAAWIMTELSPEELGARGKDWIMNQIETNYPLDVLLCPGGQTELKRLALAHERAQRRYGRGTAPYDGTREADSAEAKMSYLASSAESVESSASSSDDSEEVDGIDSDGVFRRHTRLILQNDLLPSQVHTRPRSHAHVSPLQEDNDGPARTSTAVDAVEYTVGTLFQHRRYGYRGVIVSWDAHCAASTSWIQQMGVDQLDGGGRNQPFYHIIADDSSRRYVAQCNISPVLGVRSRRRIEQRERERLRRGEGYFSRTFGAMGMRAGGVEGEEGIEDFIQLLHVRGIGREFRSADPERCRLRKNHALREAFPDDDSSVEESDDGGEDAR